MSARPPDVLQQYLRRLCERSTPPADDVLLERFVHENDRTAFELLIARHGPMVLGSARRLVNESHDADDVFQAVFLSLSRLAKTIRKGQTLPAWLHQATCRIAAKMRMKRRANASFSLPSLASREHHVEIDPAARLVWEEVRQALDDELRCLPEQLRSPLILCYLSGLTRDEAAKQLGWSLATLKRRLEEGRQALRLRLERRGIAAVGLAVTVLAPQLVQASVTGSLIESSLHHVFSIGTAIPTKISSLVLGSTSGMRGVAMKSLFSFLLCVVVGAGIYCAHGQVEQELGQNLPPSAPGEGRNPGAVQQPNPAFIAQTPGSDDELPAGATLRFGTSRFRQGVRVQSMAVSPDGRFAVTTNDTAPLRAFELSSGRTLFSLNWGGVEVASISPDGQTLVFRQGDSLYVRDAATGNEVRTINGPRENPWKGDVLEFTPDGKLIATVSNGKVVHLIDYENGETIRDFVHENPESALNGFSQVLAVAFSPDGKRMATGGYANDKENYFARLWDVRTGKELRRFFHGKQGSGIRTLAFSPDGKSLATLGTQSGVPLRLFDVETGNLQREFPKDDNVRPERGSVAFSSDGTKVAAAGTSIRLYDIASGKERLRIDRRASDLQFSKDGKTLTAAVAGAIERWDTATGKSLIPESGDSVVDQILVTADGKRVITRGQDGFAHIWDGASAKHIRRFPAGANCRMAISPDGRYLAWPVADYDVLFADPATPDSNYYGTRVRLFDIATDKFVDRFPTFKGTAAELTFTSDGKKIVIIDQHPGMVRIWDFNTANEERSFPVALPPKDKTYQVTQTALSPDGTSAVVTYQEHSKIDRWGLNGPPQHVRNWDVRTGTELPGLEGDFPGQPVRGAFSSDGRRFITSVGKVFEIATGKQVADLQNLYPRAASFSTDGRLLATAGTGNAVQLWDTVTWSKLGEYQGHRDQATALAFTPAGRLLSGSVDTTVLSWNAQAPR
jgi:RNA polymerase sigma factor (sigma-70 family)